MPEKQNKEIVAASMEAYNKGSPEIFYQLFDISHIYHGNSGLEIKGSQALKDFDQLSRITFPDQQMEVKGMIAEGEIIALWGVFHGTFTGKFKNIDPTGNNIAVNSIYIYRFANGKIVETWVARDMLNMLQQMGIAQKAV
jgi:predicted ester cyclase